MYPQGCFKFGYFYAKAACTNNNIAMNAYTSTSCNGTSTKFLEYNSTCDTTQGVKASCEKPTNITKGIGFVTILYSDD